MIHQLTEKSICLEISIGAYNIAIYGTEKRPGIRYNTPYYSKEILLELPPGNWTFIGTSKECREEQAAKVVDFSGTHYKDYTTLISNFISAQYSLKSLLRSKSLDPVNNNYAILIKED